MILQLQFDENHFSETLSKFAVFEEKSKPVAIPEAILATVHCPECQAAGSLCPHKSYPRHFYDSVNDIQMQTQITIQVYKCTECGSYHAFLPLNVLPFSPFSARLIISIVRYFNKHGKMLNQTARHFHILPRQLKHLLQIWNDHIEVIRANVRLIKDLNDLIRKENHEQLMAFLRKFYRAFEISFFCLHLRHVRRNPFRVLLFRWGAF